MKFDWTEYLTLARELAGRSDEASLRSAISRAYYAAFGEARERLVNEGLFFLLDAQVHALVWEEFERGDGVRHYVGIDGTYLRRLRNKADYDAEMADLPRQAQTALRKADQVINGLNRLAAAEQQAPLEPPTA